jgi:hypothetical protein
MGASMARARCFTVLGLVASTFAPLRLAQAEDTKNPPPNPALCIECLKFRVGLPRVVRGPETFGVDSPFTEIKLPNGRFRGFFGGGGSSYAIDGNAPSDMGGPKVAVLNPGGPGSCNQSLQHVEPAGKILLGWIHNETACAAGRHKSMSLATSTDNGLTWHVEGPIITGRDAPDPNRNTGEGDCSAVNGGDGYYYAYCWRNTNGGTIVARAPVANPGPGNWKKYFNGAWSEPALGGDASKLGGASTAAARWVPFGVRVYLGGGGRGLSFSTDDVNFAGISEPLVIGDKNVSWFRAADPHDLMAYWSLLDAKTGSNQLSGDEWNLFYLDLQPHEGFNKRYLVMRPIDAWAKQDDQYSVYRCGALTETGRIVIAPL